MTFRDRVREWLGTSPEQIEETRRAVARIDNRFDSLDAALGRRSIERAQMDQMEVLRALGHVAGFSGQDAEMLGYRGLRDGVMAAILRGREERERCISLVDSYRAPGFSSKARAGLVERLRGE